MAARKKKQDVLAPLGAGQEQIGNTIMEGLVMTAEMTQEQFVSSDGGLVVGNTDSLLEGFSHSEQVEAESKEGDMSNDTDSLEIQAADEMMAEETVEPVITLDANLSIQNVVKLYDKIKKAYAAYDAIEIDASHVASVDTATLQLFVALKKDAVKQKKDVEFFQPSARFIESARLLDFLETLDIIDV